MHKSFAGFCVCIFIIGNGLGSLETAANPYITGTFFFFLFFFFVRHMLTIGQCAALPNIPKSASTSRRRSMASEL